jgi:hypothetical protein
MLPFFLFPFFLEHKRRLTTWLSFLSSTQTISRSGIEPPTTPFSLSTSPISSGSLWSSRTYFWACVMLLEHYIYIYIVSCQHMKGIWVHLRVSLDYSEKVHWLVSNFNPRQGYIWDVGWYGGQDGSTSFFNFFDEKIPQVRVLQRPCFLSKVLRLPNKLDLQRTPSNKKI